VSDLPSPCGPSRSDGQPAGNCASVRAELSASIDGELDPTQQEAVERHLAACSACRAEAALLRLVSQAVRQVPRLEPREELRDQVLGQVRAEATIQPAAEGHVHRVEFLITERAGERFMYRQEVGAFSARPLPPPPEATATATSHTLVQWHQQRAGNQTMFYQVVEIG
jgi:anti-sigma factor (TIGR02949 family)